MTWDDAIKAASEDQSYDLSQLTPEQAAKLFQTKVDGQKIDQLIEDLRAAIATNEANAAKVANVVAVLKTIVAIGKIIA